MTILSRSIAVLCMAGAAMVGLAATAQAADANADYGQHVRTCAQGTGFDGEHNPGMHQGKSGWDPSHHC